MSAKKIVGIISICFIILAGTFFIGFKTGVETGWLFKAKPTDADFRLFWKVWKIVRNNYIKPNDLNSQKMVYGAIKGFVDSLGDPYSVFFPPADAKKFTEYINDNNFGGIGIGIRAKKGILTVTSISKDMPAWKAGLIIGDQIVEIDGQSTLNMTMTIGGVIGLVRGPKGTKVILTIVRKGIDKPMKISIVRDVIVVTVTTLKFLDNNIAYLQLKTFNKKAYQEFCRSALEIINRKSPALILDLRNNPGGYLSVSVDIAGWFLDKGAIVVRENIRGAKEILIRIRGNQGLCQLPVIVLINEGTASASEILAGALRDVRNIKLVGVKSYGKGLVQVSLKFFDDSIIKLTIAEWLTPNGASINKKGLNPDYKVEMPEDNDSEIDPQLDKALEVIKKLI